MEIKKSMQLAEVEVSYKSKITPEDRLQIKTSHSTANYARQVWDEGKIEYCEEVMLLMLNPHLQVLGWVKIAQGGLNFALIDPKVVFSIALTSNASGIILVHNHPSGNIKPSQHDIRHAAALKKAGEMLEIKVHDSIIITTNSHYSLSDEGLI